MKRVLALFVIAAAVSACAPPAPDLAAARDALTQADAAYAQSITGKNVDAWTAFYAADARLFPPNAATISGAEGIRAFGQEAIADPSFTAAFQPAEVEIAPGGDMGYTLAAYQITMTGPDGQAVTEMGRDFHVWKKQADGSWKIVIDIWNSDQAPAAR